MIESIGQDITNHLHDHGGPLDCSRERSCSECEGAIEEGRYHAIGQQVLCDQCAPTIALRIVASTMDWEELQEAFDVLAQFARELAAGEWRR